MRQLQPTRRMRARFAYWVAATAACGTVLAFAASDVSADSSSTSATGATQTTTTTTAPLDVRGSATPSGGSRVVVPGSPGNCFAGNACAWIDNYYSGSIGYWSVNDSDFTNDTWGPCFDWNNLDYNWNDCASSMYNDLNSCNATWYKDAGYGGSYYRNNNGTGDPNLSPYWNDRFSSFKKCNY